MNIIVKDAATRAQEFTKSSRKLPLGLIALIAVRHIGFLKSLKNPKRRKNGSNISLNFWHFWESDTMINIRANVFKLAAVVGRGLGMTVPRAPVLVTEDVMLKKIWMIEPPILIFIGLLIGHILTLIAIMTPIE